VSLRNLQNALRDLARVKIRVRLWLWFGFGLTVTVEVRIGVGVGAIQRVMFRVMFRSEICKLRMRDFEIAQPISQIAQIWKSRATSP